VLLEKAGIALRALHHNNQMLTSAHCCHLYPCSAAAISQAIAARYGVLLEKAGIALRGLFIINPEGIIQQITINDLVSVTLCNKMTRS
jgi:alkyl hydroperoxide reductase subunit AhpC